jgi:uncharacterized protein (TIGR02145 family)
MKLKYLLPLTALLTLVGCFGTDSDNKSPKETVPVDFEAICYWESHQSVQGECGKNDESCIENHYLEVGQRADFEYECSEDDVSSAVVSSSSDGGTSSVVEASSSSFSSEGTFTDSRDNKSYKYVTIGDQVWMAENLNYDISGSFCYDDDVSNCTTYGRLYTWETAMSGAASSAATPSGVQGVCPSGWHLPSDSEWQILAQHLSLELGYGNMTSNSWSELGSELKSKTRWDTNPNKNDAFGFSGLPSGHFDGGSFTLIGANASWRTSEGNGMSLIDDSNNFQWFVCPSNNGRAIRCLKD